MTCRQLEEGEADLEALMVGGSAGAVIWGAGWMWSGLPLPRCVFHVMTGCPCPTCGATRCVLALMHGRVAEAAAWNPMVFAGIAALAMVNVYAAGMLAGWWPRVRMAVSARERRILPRVFGILWAANWAYEIHHGV